MSTADAVDAVRTDSEPSLYGWIGRNSSVDRMVRCALGELHESIKALFCHARRMRCLNAHSRAPRSQTTCIQYFRASG